MKCEIDARGLACPHPVVLTKNKMKEYKLIEIIVDNEIALENIKRLALNSGWTFEINHSNNNFIIKLAAEQNKLSSKEITGSITPDKEGSVFVFSSDKMGDGDPALGIILMKAFIHTLASDDSTPSKIIFYNSGVLLTSENSGVTDDLEILQDKGVEILICGTCVNFYNITEKTKIGTISNMYDILTTMSNSKRLVNP